MPQPGHQTEVLPHGTRVWTTSRHRITQDALLLAKFCRVSPRHTVCDLGSGCGILLLALCDGGYGGLATGIELDAAGTALLEGAASENGLANIRALTGDFRLHRPARQFDCVVANPPYFPTGHRAQDPQRAAARHEMHCTRQELCAAAARLLRQGGRFFLCYPPARLAGLCSALMACGLAPKRLQWVRHTPQSEPSLALIEAQKGAGEGLRVLQDHIVEAAPATGPAPNPAADTR